MDSLYTRCPSCGIIAPAGSLSVALTDDGTFDPDEPLTVSCLPAEHRYTITTAALFPRDTALTCGCGTTFGCPAEADEATCPHCHRHQPGPFLDLDPERRAYVHQVHTDYRRNILHELRLFHDDGPAG